MFLKNGDILLRPLELNDAEQLYEYKNDLEIAKLLGGFSNGYSREDIINWIKAHANRNDEILWSIIYNDKCIGHIGLYKIDYRVRAAEFGILIGDKNIWGKNIGVICSRLVIDYAFSELNLNRLYLSVLATNERALNLYKKLGFIQEGCLREAQFKNNSYIDVIIMSILRDEYEKK